MNTKLLMTVSAIVLGLMGIILSFLPQEISGLIGIATTNILILQLMGALYFGFAMFNWTAKGNLIGGIYSRPIVIGNFSHFLIGALALSKVVNISLNNSFVLPTLVVYSIFAVLFGLVMITNPRTKNTTKEG